MAIWTNSNTTYPSFIDTPAKKRNVVRTPLGWIRVSKRRGSPNETLIISANTSAIGAPAIIDMVHTVGGVVKSTAANTDTITTLVSFNQPIQNLGGAVKLTVANTVSGKNTFKAVASAQTVVEGNKLRMTWSPTNNGTYKIQAQTASNNTGTAVSVRSTTAQGNTAVSLVVSGTVSNTAGSIVVS